MFFALLSYDEIFHSIVYCSNAVRRFACHQPKSSDPAAKPYFHYPAISPNGSGIAFVSGGDIWTVPAAGGEARLLIFQPATETRPLYAPNGSYLAFTSTCSGNGDIYVMNLTTNELIRLTYDDDADELSAWSKDGQ